MGGGRTNRPEVPKFEPFDLVAAVAASANGEDGGGEPSQPALICERTHVIGFHVAPGAEVTRGIAVRLRPGKPPVAVTATEDIGPVAEADAITMGGCLDLGYKMSGIVSEYEQGSASGRATVAGSRT